MTRGDDTRPPGTLSGDERDEARAERARPAPAGGPAADRAARLTRDPVCSSYG